MQTLEHRNRLARSGVEYLEAVLAATGRRIRVLDPGEVNDDLVRYMVEALTSMCTPLYGHWSARERAAAALSPARAVG